MTDSDQKMGQTMINNTAQKTKDLTKRSILKAKN
jgi:hypothetical protein